MLKWRGWRNRMPIDDAAQNYRSSWVTFFISAAELRGEFDHVMMNPPYWEDKVSISPSLKKTQAHHEGKADLAAFCENGCGTSVSGGTLTVIHRADRRAEILSLLSKPDKNGGIVVYPLWPGLKLMVHQKGKARSWFRLFGIVRHRFGLRRVWCCTILKAAIRLRPRLFAGQICPCFNPRRSSKVGLCLVYPYQN